TMKSKREIDDDFAKAIKSMTVAREAILKRVEAQKNHTHERSLMGIVAPCPACNHGHLRWSWIRSNGHISGICSEGCVSWVELCLISGDAVAVAMIPSSGSVSTAEIGSYGMISPSCHSTVLAGNTIQ